MLKRVQVWATNAIITTLIIFLFLLFTFFGFHLARNVSLETSFQSIPITNFSKASSYKGKRPQWFRLRYKHSRVAHYHPDTLVNGATHFLCAGNWPWLHPPPFNLHLPKTIVTTDLTSFVTQLCSIYHSQCTRCNYCMCK